MAESDVKIIDNWLVERMCVIIDNDQPLWNEVTEAARQAVCEYVPGDDEGSDYAALLAGEHSMYTERDYANAVGSSVAEVIKSWLEEQHELPISRILSDILALDGWHIQSLLGDHYLPTEL